VSESRGAAASYKIQDSGGSPRVAMAAGVVQVSTAPVEKPLRLPVARGRKQKIPHTEGKSWGEAPKTTQGKKKQNTQ